MKSFIEGVSIKEATGLVWNMARPARHCDVFREIAKCFPGAGRHINAIQGFFTNEGNFVDRFEALNIARAAGQIISKHPPHDRLVSEDVW